MNIVEMLFGRTVTPAERLRQHQRALTKAQRELDRERTKLEQSEKKLIMDIKKSAKAGQLVRDSLLPVCSSTQTDESLLPKLPCSISAECVQSDGQGPRKNTEIRSEVLPDADQLQAVGLRIHKLRSNQQMAEAMRGATRAMASMNRGLNLPAIQKIMNEFEKESSMMDMKEEMMSDAVDDVMEDDLEDEEEEGDKILKEVLDEIGVDLSQQLTDAPIGIAAQSAPLADRRPVALGEGGGSSHNDTSTGGSSGGGGGMSDEDALQARLDALRRS